jgi:hypothetical protein
MRKGIGHRVRIEKSEDGRKIFIWHFGFFFGRLSGLEIKNTK